MDTFGKILMILMGIATFLSQQNFPPQTFPELFAMISGVLLVIVGVLYGKVTVTLQRLVGK